MLIIKLCQWASDYYQHPLGEIFLTAIPNLLRQGKPAQFRHKTCWQLTPDAFAIEPSSLSKAPKQQLLLEYLQQNNRPLNSEQLKVLNCNKQTVAAFVKKAWLTEHKQECCPSFTQHELTSPLSLNTEQSHAFHNVTKELHRFNCYLLDGITGSGKTEVYLQAVQTVIDSGKQCLILVPEIGLTPQIVNRFQRRFNVPIAVMHSGLNDRERLDAWLMAKRGISRIIIGTRSAIFTPIPELGLIIIDEEHDASFKQQDGFRYSARDLAIVRSQMANIPIVLGSATPSLESLQNAKHQRYQLLQLKQRAGNAIKPKFQLIDIRNQTLQQGLSSNLLSNIKTQLELGNQVLLFINRRGYAPVLMCHHCAWVANCVHCDAHLTLHQAPAYLQCHHCGATRRVETHCQHPGSQPR